ncbi:MAG: aminotransferase class IV [Pseudomonadota bacterium]
MIATLDTAAYVAKMLSVPRVGAEKILAFYEHRVGAICRDAHCMLMPLDDHLAHRGDGIFESMKYEHGRIYQLDAHLTRMERSAAGLMLMPPCSWLEMREIILDVARATGQEAGMLRILVGRGSGGFGIDPAECPEASLYIAAYAFSPKSQAWYDKGLTAFRSSIPAKQSYLARIKNANYVPNMMMVREAHERNMDVAFGFDKDGHLTEAAIANVAIVDANGNLAVPRFDNALAGTTVLRGMELMGQHIHVEQRNITEDEIFHAREVLMFGTSSDCVSIVAYEGKPIQDGKAGPVAKKVRALLQADLLENGVCL